MSCISKDNRFIIIPIYYLLKNTQYVPIGTYYILLIMVDGRHRKCIVLYFDCIHFLRITLSYLPIHRVGIPPTQCNIVTATCKSRDRQRQRWQLIDGRVAALSVQSRPVVRARVYAYVCVYLCVCVCWHVTCMSLVSKRIVAAP